MLRLCFLCKGVRDSLGSHSPMQQSMRLRFSAWQQAGHLDSYGSSDEWASLSGGLSGQADTAEDPGQHGSREQNAPLDFREAWQLDTVSLACRTFPARLDNPLQVASWVSSFQLRLRHPQLLGQQWRGMAVFRRRNRDIGEAPPPRLNVYSSRPAQAPVRLVAEDGSHRILPYGDALAEARASGADLVEVAPHAQPPVVKLGQADKAMFERRLKEKELKRRQLEARRAQAVKEVRVGSQIAEHDLDMKLRLAEEFLEKGFRVKVTVTFKNVNRMNAGRKLSEIVNKVKSFALVASPAANERVMQNTFAIFLSPLPESAKEA